MPLTLATPSAENCTGCSFQIICPAFWQCLQEGRLQGLGDTAMSGDIVSVEPGPDDDLYIANIETKATSHPLERQQPVVLRKSIQGDLSAAILGRACRLVDFKVRADGRVRTEPSTVILADDDCPVLATKKTHN
jgi:hypothetical protein